MNHLIAVTSDPFVPGASSKVARKRPPPIDVGSGNGPALKRTFAVHPSAQRMAWANEEVLCDMLLAQRGLAYADLLCLCPDCTRDRVTPDDDYAIKYQYLIRIIELAEAHEHGITAKLVNTIHGDRVGMVKK